MLEEERSEMRSDFYIKVNSFVSEIDQLKQKLSSKFIFIDEYLLGYEAPIPEESKLSGNSSINQTIGGDLSMAATGKEKNPTFMDQSQTSHIHPAV